ncbi:MAG: biotin/lipoyl-binding protein [Kiritimatiellaeota bacterium]|nr:biotin/lipoyl-binding protein [Kiritimatiellota bacterium]
MARKFDVYGTKDFMFWAIILAAWGLWCVKDGWFPSESTLERHPPQVPITAEAPGLITEILIRTDQTVAEGQVVARLAPSRTNAPVMLKAPVRGDVLLVSVTKNSEVKRGDPIAVLIPQLSASYYSFNRSSAFLSLLGAAVCAFIHRTVR